MRERDLWRIRQLNDLSTHDLGFFNKVHPTYDDYKALYLNLKDMKHISQTLIHEAYLRQKQRVMYRDAHEAPTFKSVPKESEDSSDTTDNVQPQAHVDGGSNALKRNDAIQSSQIATRPHKKSLGDKLAQCKNKYVPKMKSELRSFFESDEEYAERRKRENI